MKIIITGTPCTGKTLVAKILGKKLKLPVTHINEFIKKKKIGMKKGKEIEVYLPKLKKELSNINGIIESHLLCEFSIPNSIVFVLRCNPHILEKRMKKRRYSATKIRENLECEALDYCTQLAEKNYSKVYDIDTTKCTPYKTAEKILKILKEKSKGDYVDFSNWFLENY